MSDIWLGSISGQQITVKSNPLKAEVCELVGAVAAGQGLDNDYIEGHNNKTNRPSFLHQRTDWRGRQENKLFSHAELQLLWGSTQRGTWQWLRVS